ncbi:MAG: YitT family protein [Clostridiales bacterium]|nr:YitT family protein [Clostridiales bacterium]
MKKNINIVISLIIGAFTGATALNSIIIPNNLMSGGMPGLALLLNKGTGLNMQLLLGLLFVPIAVWAFIKFGIKQIITAAACYLLFTFFLGITPLFIPVLKTDLIVAAITSGIMIGFCGGIVLRLGVANGPESLIGMHLKDRYNITQGTFMTVFNTLIVLASVLYADLTLALYSAISIYISGKVTDYIMLGFGRYFEMNIVSGKYLELTEFIHKEIKRGVTYIQCMDTFELKKYMMLKILVKNDEIIKIKHYLNVLDPDSLIYLNESTEVVGKGFKD